MVFGNDDEKPYEFIGLSIVMLKNSRNSYGFGNDDEKPYEFIGLSIIMFKKQ